METRTVRMNRHYKCSTLNSKLHRYDIHGRHLQILAVDILLKFDAALVLKIEGNVTFSVEVKLNEDFNSVDINTSRFLKLPMLNTLVAGVSVKEAREKGVMVVDHTISLYSEVDRCSM